MWSVCEFLMNKWVVQLKLLFSFFSIFTISEQKIDDVVLLDLITDEELKELIPFLGDRKKFKMALHKDGAKILPSALPSENIMVYINF